MESSLHVMDGKYIDKINKEKESNLLISLEKEKNPPRKCKIQPPFSAHLKLTHLILNCSYASMANVLKTGGLY